MRKSMGAVLCIIVPTIIGYSASGDLDFEYPAEGISNGAVIRAVIVIIRWNKKTKIKRIVF
jgi:hypothetical protein